MGKVAALSRFISRSSDKCHKLFKVLKKGKHVAWNEEYTTTLQELKAYISSPPLLAKPVDGEKLLVYLVVSQVGVSAVLVREENAHQCPIYYVSKILLPEETRYPHLEIQALDLVTTARKLCPYFQCHPITVVTTFPLRTILQKPKLSRRLEKWAI